MLLVLEGIEHDHIKRKVENVVFFLHISFAEYDFFMEVPVGYLQSFVQRLCFR